MPIWEWLRAGSIKKNLQKKYGHRDGTSYGEVTRRDQTKPDRSEKFRAEGFTWTEVQAFIDCANTPADQAGGVLSITDHLDQDWAGPIASLDWKPVGIGGTIYWDVDLELDNPVGPT